MKELKEELLWHKFEATDISNIEKRITQNTLSLFFIDLKQEPNNETDYDIDQLMNSMVNIESPHKNNSVVLKI